MPYLRHNQLGDCSYDYLATIAALCGAVGDRSQIRTFPHREVGRRFAEFRRMVAGNDDEYEDEDNPGMNQYGDPYEGRRGPTIAELDAESGEEDAADERAARRRIRPILEQIKSLPDDHDRELILRWFMLYVTDYGNFYEPSARGYRQTVLRAAETGYHEYCWLVLRETDDYGTLDGEDRWHLSGPDYMALTPSLVAE